jgi:hypothetical protein
MAYKISQGDNIPQVVQKFCADYRIDISLTSKQRAEYEPTSFDPYGYSSVYMTKQLTYQPIVRLEISESDLERLINDADDAKEINRTYGPHVRRILDESSITASRNMRESLIRKEHPGVQLAWDKYQMMLKLAGGV